MIEMILC